MCYWHSDSPLWCCGNGVFCGGTAPDESTVSSTDNTCCLHATRGLPTHRSVVGQAWWRQAAHCSPVRCYFVILPLLGQLSRVCHVRAFVSIATKLVSWFADIYLVCGVDSRTDSSLDVDICKQELGHVRRWHRLGARIGAIVRSLLRLTAALQTGSQSDEWAAYLPLPFLRLIG